MGRKSTQKQSGLVKRGSVWHIDKRYKHAPGGRIRESTGESDFNKAQDVLIFKLEECRKASLFGVRRDYTFREAATKYLLKNQDKSRIKDSAYHLKLLDPYIGNLPLKLIFDESLEQFVKDRKQAGCKNKTINLSLGIVRQIINLAAYKWHDEYGKTWLEKAPTFEMQDNDDAREPYPLSNDEQKWLFSCLPDHLQTMALFKVNTGLRDKEVCNLSWDYEIDVPELNTSVFLLPKGFIKNKEDRLIVLNKTAKAIINKMRDQHEHYVFHYRGKKLSQMNNSAWKSARIDAAIIAVKNDKKCNYQSLDVTVDRIDQKVIATVKGLNKDGTNDSVVYTSDDYNEEREKKGLPPASKSKRSDYHAIRVVVKREAVRRFIDAFWPLHSMFCNVRVHDLKHTFGRRLRSACISNEDRKILLGHTNDDITTHYSEVELESLIKSANAINTTKRGNGPTLTILKNRVKHGKGVHKTSTLGL